jgi:transcriptional regulator with XRE-family HTH domain
MEQKSHLAERRKALGLSQAQLADLLGVNQATVSRNENAAEPDMRFCLALEALELRRKAAA